MAQKANTEELKQKAILAIAAGREEISAEVVRVRDRLRPMRVLQRAVDRHTGLSVALAVTAGIIPVLLIFRGRRVHHSEYFPTVVTVPSATPKPLLGALLLGAVGILARTVTPALIKSAIIPQVLQYIEKRQRKAASEIPRD